jgi:hypothetical protein
MLEIAFLVVCVVLGLWWFSRTNIYRAHRRSGADPGQFGVGTSHSIGMLGGQTGGLSGVRPTRRSKTSSRSSLRSHR